MQDSFPESFDPTRCVLFLGAGFSADARNKHGTNPPIGNGLGKAIKEFAGMSEDYTDDLSDLAGYAIRQNLELFELLEGLYTIQTITEEQRKILSQPWWRIYTTNYDNSVTVFRAERGFNATDRIFDLTDEVPRQLRKEAVVHLHGSIAKCDRNRLNESLILSRRSYVEQRAKKSPWWDWFDRDIRTSQYVFFLGYDLNDFEPANYLIRYPDIKERCHFILKEPNNPIAATKLNDYGSRHAFELKGFAERLKRARIAPSPAHENELRSFRYVDITKDDKLPSKPGSAEIQELLAFGRMRFDSLKATIPSSEYVVYRKSALDESQAALKTNTTLVVHSKIGNGKTIVCDQLKVTLSRVGYQCFELRENVTPLQQDVDFIRELPSAVIFFPSYDSAVSNFHLLDGLSDKTKYVVEMPTSTLQVRMDEVRDNLRGNIARVNVDRLDATDAAGFRDLLKRAGLSALASSPEIRAGLEFRDFLLLSYEDPEIAQRLKAVIEPLVHDRAAGRVIVASAILKAAGLQVDTGFIEDATDEDPYATLSGFGEPVLELMEYSLDKLEPHSSVLSEHILRRYISKKDFSGAIYHLAAEAARRIEETSNYGSERFRRARAILSSALRFGFVESIIGQRSEDRKFIGKLYESCRNHLLIQKEPLFWLQYSIYWQDLGRWDLAETHMIEAYHRGMARTGFKTFQLDTNYLGLLCDLELNDQVGRPIKRFDTLLGLIDVCRSMVDDGNHRGHVLKSFLKLDPMVSKRIGDFTKPQATSLTYALNLVIQRLDQFQPGERAIWGTDLCKASLECCVRSLTQRSYS